MKIVDRLRACWGFSPNVDRNVALVDGFLNGKTVAELAQEHRLSKTRARQIIEKADRLVGGGMLTKAEPSEAPLRSDFMAAYQYVWSLAETHRKRSPPAADRSALFAAYVRVMQPGGVRAQQDGVEGGH